MHGVAKPAYLGVFLCSGLPRVAPYCVPGGVRVVSISTSHYRLEEALNNPPAMSRPRPPIMVGGMGEKKTLRLVAQYADACNLFAYGGAGTIRHKLEVLKRHCEDVGRDYEER